MYKMSPEDVVDAPKTRELLKTAEMHPVKSIWSQREETPYKPNMRQPELQEENKYLPIIKTH